MRLPNFFKSAGLNRLKEKMGRAPDYYGAFATDPDRLTAVERELLETGEGIEVTFDQLTVLPDKTLAYKDSRVLLYIRDVHVYGGRTDDWYPRYHLTHCSKLKEMTSAGRFERYVIASETEGEFILNMIASGKLRSERRRLPVCQMCLAGISFDGFSLRGETYARQQFVKKFTPGQFFAVYPRSLHSAKPKHTSASAPLNTYSRNFPEISRRYREQADWRCEKCCRCFRYRRQYLHVHHDDGNRSDNRPRNLRALCIVCHAEQPMHSHLKSHPDYRALIQEIRQGII